MQLHARPGIWETTLSMGCLGAVLTALIAVDARVHERFFLLFAEARSEGVGTWGDRLQSLGAAIVQAARDHSLDQAPLLIFAAVGVVLLFFMLRT